MSSGFFQYKIDQVGLPFLLDLDEVYQLRSSGQPTAPATGFFSIDGRDLNQRYLPIAQGEAHTENVGFVVSGIGDLSTIFSKKLTPSSGVPNVGFLNFQNALSSTAGYFELGAAPTAGVIISLMPDGSANQNEFMMRDGASDESIDYPANWYDLPPSSGIGANYEVQFDASGLELFGEEAGGSSIINPAENYIPISTQRTFSVQVTATVGAQVQEYIQISGTLVINIRAAGTTTPVSTKSMAILVRAFHSQ